MAVLRALRAWLLAAMLIGTGHAATPTEYQVEAVFLLNFARFIEWPDAAFSDSAAPFVVGVFGFDPFGTDLDAVVHGASARGRPLIVRRVQNVREIAGCQILFIHHSEAKRLAEVLAALGRYSTLTVSDLEEAAQRGVMIRLKNQDGRIRMRINLESVRAAQLSISSNLLRIADVTSSTPEGP